MLKDVIDKLEDIDWLIQRKATGTPRELAGRLRLSRSSLYDYLTLLKDCGAPIGYCKRRLTYFYKEEGEFSFKFKKNVNIPVVSAPHSGNDLPQAINKVL